LRLLPRVFSALSVLSDRSFWRSSGLLLLASLIGGVLALVRMPLMTWLLPKNQVGVISVVASWLPFLQLLSLSGLDTASYHYVAGEKHWAYVVGIVHRLRWSLLSVFGFLAGAIYWWWRGEGLLVQVFVIAALTFPVVAGLTACGSTLGARQDFHSLFWYRLGESLCTFAGFVPLGLSLVWLSRVSTYYLANQVVLGCMHLVFCFYLVRQLGKEKIPRPETDETRGLLRYGRHLTVLNGISVLQSQGDALIVGTLMPVEIMADYSIALMIQQQIKRLWIIYVSVRYPLFVRMPVVQRRRQMLWEGAAIWFCFIAAGFVFCLAAPWLFSVFLPSSYLSSLKYVNWLTATTLVGTPGGIAEVYFRSEQNEKRQYTMRVIGATSLVLSLVLLGRLGVSGVIAGRFVANLIFSITGVWLFARDSR